MNDLVEIGRNILKLRKNQGMTQEELAFQSDRSVHCLQNIERKYKNTTVDTLIKISHALHIDSRVLGIFARTDIEILSEIRKEPYLPKKNGNVFQFCDNIVLLRNERNMPQKQLAIISGISAAWLRNIEQGCANMSIYRLICIANAFDISLMKLGSLSMPEEQLMKLVFEARERAGIT